MNGVLLKKLFDMALSYIQTHPELIDKIMDLLWKKISPNGPAVFSAVEEVDPTILEFSAACDEAIASGS
jgi:hypothetical protein